MLHQAARGAAQHPSRPACTCLASLVLPASGLIDDGAVRALLLRGPRANRRKRGRAGLVRGPIDHVLARQSRDRQSAAAGTGSPRSRARRTPTRSSPRSPARSGTASARSTEEASGRAMGVAIARDGCGRGRSAAARAGGATRPRRRTRAAAAVRRSRSGRPRARARAAGATCGAAALERRVTCRGLALQSSGFRRHRPALSRHEVYALCRLGSRAEALRAGAAARRIAPHRDARGARGR